MILIITNEVIVPSVCAIIAAIVIGLFIKGFNEPKDPPSKGGQNNYPRAA